MSAARKVAALFVAPGGIYFGRPDVDPWDEKRDARLYAGPHPVVAHPPCARWGRFAEVSFGRRHGGKWGDDGGCFAAALDAVRKWGGVLEHPAHSGAWLKFDLPFPPTKGWAGDLLDGGWACSVEQGHFGHRTRKATWLYYVGDKAPPVLPSGPSMPDGYVPCARKGEAFTRLSARQRSATPGAFADLMLSVARSARPTTEGA